MAINALDGKKPANSYNDLFCIQNGFCRATVTTAARLGFDKEKSVIIEHVDAIETRDGKAVMFSKKTIAVKVSYLKRKDSGYWQVQSIQEVN
jgi:hypothetical protein